ncbi:hypothetical protein ACSNOI_03315 [Actinomadura kijaniata]|uniref:hypothetical protein n=1 Tax=Actinomadura kijaniata TaxID=46161 RepID=UPI003F1C869C
MNHHDDDGGGDGEHQDELVVVELVGGPLDGLRQALATAAELEGPREDLGVLMIVEGWSERALYEPDPPPAPASLWRYRGPVAI